VTFQLDPIPSQSEIQKALAAFVASIIDTSVVPFIAGDENRVPEPSGGDFIVLTMLFKNRLATNIDTYADVSFTGATAGTVLTASAFILGSRIDVNAPLFGVGVSTGTRITSQLTGPPGGLGTYTIAPAQDIASEKMAAGKKLITEKWEYVFQLSVHSDDIMDSSDLATTLSIALRDTLASEFFGSFLDPDTGLHYEIMPLHADDPKKITMENAEQQTETVWIVTAHFQVDQTIFPAQQFADQLETGITEVDML